jgi:alpha-N-arabinofuranosidase
MDTKPSSHRLHQILLMLICGACLVAPALGGEMKAVTYRVDTANTVGDIDINIYGQFLEHIFNSVHGGLWDDMILNPSLERKQDALAWFVDEGVIQVEGLADNTPIAFGDETWTDYEITMDARVTGHNKGINIPFRWQGPKDYYMMNFGTAGHRKW